ncbi:hypothetical protein TRFO_21332 [Tritrichomonas foetus]|uniref:HCP-like protein n=1 Tax=Tritrichomonas foetus TaxID=1144522 RepID=A0A1J4KIR6_9EUKA|nr:hypothetical protein TRFO_21332 [Tritrichomonas foetus]|eukprot:OHT09708.1 hypothetical protein TRFO_21332 [Tritrichomonas foetus]
MKGLLGPKDHRLAQHYFELSVANGDGDSLFELANFYKVNNFNHDKYLEYLHEAASKDHELAKLTLFKNYINSAHTYGSINYAEQIAYSEAEKGNFHYLYSLITKTRDRRKIRLYLEIIKNNCDENTDPKILFLTSHYLINNPRINDDEKARTFLEWSVKQGYIPACYYYGKNYLLRRKKNEKLKKKGLKLVHYAADNGEYDACHHLGLNYLNGNFGPKDYKLAFKYFKIAAENGQIESQRSLGQIYLYNDQFKDIEKSIHYFKMAADQDDEKGLIGLGEAYRQLNDKEKSFTYFTMACEIGSSDAHVELGKMYKDGKFFEKDYKKAIEHFTIAMNQNNSDAFYQIGKMYYKGEGVPLDEARGREYIVRASSMGNNQASRLLSTYQF